MVEIIKGTRGRGAEKEQKEERKEGK